MLNGNPTPGPLNSRYFRPVRRKETRARRCDLEFESTSLQQAVCLSGEPPGCRRKAPHFGGILRVVGDLRRDAQAANRDFFAPSL